MSIRIIATPITIASFLTVAITGLLMLLGRHAGLIGVVHEVSSVVFVLGSILHILVNIRPTLAHLRRPMGASLAVLFLLMTVAALVPVEEKSPNPRRAFMQSGQILLELNAQELASITHQAKAVVLEDLAKAGFNVPDENATLKAIAAANHREAFEVLSIALARVPSSSRP